MKITRDNYESWFLDYLEGRLEEGRMDEFLRFLHENQDLKEELSGFETVTLDPPEVVFHGKENLHREIYDLPEAFDQAAIARMEGDAEPAEALRFEDFLKRYPEKRKEAELFLRTRLIPDPTIVFPGKENLYHRPVIRLMMTWTMRVAAVLLVAALVFTTLDWRLDIPGTGVEVAGTGDEIPGTIPETGTLETPGNLPDQGVTTNPGTGTEPARRTESGQVEETGNIPSAIPETSTPGKPEKNLVAQNRSMTTASSGRRATVTLPSGAGTVDASLAAGTTLVREKVPSILAVKEAAIDHAGAPVTLASATIPSPEEPLQAVTRTENPSLNEFLLEKTGLDNLGNQINNLSISKLTRFGLKVAAAVSNEKFSYDTNNDGEIIAYNLDTRLLGLSIPVKHD